MSQQASIVPVVNSGVRCILSSVQTHRGLNGIELVRACVGIEHVCLMMVAYWRLILVIGGRRIVDMLTGSVATVGFVALMHHVRRLMATLMLSTSRRLVVRLLL